MALMSMIVQDSHTIVRGKSKERGKRVERGGAGAEFSFVF